MKIIFIGCGYLGYNLSQRLQNSDDQVEIYGLPSAYSKLAPWFREVDAFNLGVMTTLDLKDAIIIDTVSLVGNNASGNEDKKLKYIHDQYQGLFELLKAKRIKRYIFLSSGGTIYGDSSQPIDEMHILNPQTLYAKSKRMLEELLIASGLDYLILRVTNPYGGYQTLDKGQGVIPILISNVLNNKPFTMWVDDKSVRDYIYIDDFAQSLKCLIKKDIDHQIINISSSIGTSLATVMRLVENYTGKQIQIEHVDSKVPVVESIVLSNEKMKALSGYEPKVSIQTGILAEINRIKGELGL